MLDPNGIIVIPMQFCCLVKKSHELSYRDKLIIKGDTSTFVHFDVASMKALRPAYVQGNNIAIFLYHVTVS
jgi:hypothetical protein